MDRVGRGRGARGAAECPAPGGCLDHDDPCAEEGLGAEAAAGGGAEEDEEATVAASLAGTPMAQASGQIYARGLDKGVEFESDRLGAEYMARAGYDPREGVEQPAD